MQGSGGGRRGPYQCSMFVAHTRSIMLRPRTLQLQAVPTPALLPKARPPAIANGIPPLPLHPPDLQLGRWASLVFTTWQELCFTSGVHPFTGESMEAGQAGTPSKSKVAAGEAPASAKARGGGAAALPAGAAEVQRCFMQACSSAQDQLARETSGLVSCGLSFCAQHACVCSTVPEAQPVSTHPTQCCTLCMTPSPPLSPPLRCWWRCCWRLQLQR